MRLSKIRMVLVLVPAGVKARVWVGIVDTEPIVWILSIPLDSQFWGIWACRGIEANRIENCLQLLGFDIIRIELDRRNLWDAIKNVPLHLSIEIRVRITAWMRDRHR
nr:hypothetical protein [Halorhabdus tiamatea]